MNNDNGQIRYGVTIDTDKMKQDAQRVVDQFDHIGREAVHQGDTVDKAFSGAASSIGKAFAAIGLATTIQSLGKQVLTIRGEFQKLEVAFQVMLGSAQKADTLMKQLVQTAATTPFDLQGVANGAKQLLAYGVSADQVNDTLVRLGNIASGLSIPLNDLVYLYGTTMTQGRLFTQDLHQFMGRGIPLADELAKQFGVTKDEVGNLVTAGKVGFPEVQKAIEAMTNEGGKFAGLMEKQSHTIAGQISSIGDALDIMFNKIGQQNEGVINGALSSVSWLIENYETIGKVLMTVVSAYGAYKAALMAVVAVQKAQALAETIQLIMMMRNELGLATAAQQAFNVTAKANPYALLLGALAALVTSLALFTENTDSATESQKDLNKIISDAKEKTVEEKQSIEMLVAAAKDEKMSLDDRKKAIYKLNKIIPNYNARLDETTQKYIENKAALDDYLNSLTRKYELEGAKDALKEIGKQIANAKIHIQGANEEIKQAEALQKKLSKSTAYNPQEAAFLNANNGQAQEKLKKGNKELEKALKRRQTILGAYGDELKKDAIGGSSNNISKNYQQEVKETKKRYENAKKLYANLKKDARSTSQQVTDAAAEVSEANKKYKELTGSDLEQSSKLSAKTAAKEHKKAVDIAKDKADLAEKELEAKKTQSQEEIELELNTRQALIDVMENGTKKAVEQIKLDKDKQLNELDKEYKAIKEKKIETAKELFEANPANKDKNFTRNENDPAYNYTEQEKQYYDSKKKAILKAYDDAVAEQGRKEMEAFQTYLEQYGTYQQKRLAIAMKYAEKIRKAQEAGEGNQVKLLTAQRDAEYSKAKTSDISQNIDWSTAFSKWGVIMADQLKGTLEDLKQMTKTDEFKNKNTSDQKEIFELIDKIEGYMNTSIKDLNFKGLGKNIDAYQSALDNYNDAKKREEEATDRLIKAKEEEIKVSKKGTDQEKEQAKKKVQTAQIEADAAATNTQAAQTALNDASAAVQSSASKTFKVMNTFSENLQNLSNGSLAAAWKGLTQLDKTLNDGKITESLAKGLGKMFEGKSDLVSMIIGAILNLLDVLKEKGIGGIIGGLIEGILSAIGGIIKNVFSGQIFTQLFDGIKNGVTSILDGITFGGFSSWFSTGNGKEVQDRTDRLTRSNEALKDSIDALKDSFDKTNGENAIKTYEQAVEYQKKVIAQQMEILQTQMRYHDAHHSNAYYWGLSNSSYAQINSLLGTNVRSLEDIYTLSPDQMDKIRKNLFDVWNEMLTQGKYDKSEYWEAYADLAGSLDALTDTVSENLTTTTFDSLRDNFVNTLMDMSNDAEDFADGFQELLTKSLLNSKIGTLLDNEIETFYNKWADTMSKQSGTLTDEQIKQYQKEWNDIIQKGLEARNTVFALTGYDDIVKKQEASSGAWESMSEDTGQELNGRFTAIQEGVYQISDDLKVQLANTSSIAASSSMHTTVLGEMENILLIANGYLETIARNTSSLPSIDEKLEKIRINTSRL